MADDENQNKERAERELAYECAVCERTYDKPGMCQVCKLALKPKGE